jgi:hypothetical protein
MMNVRTLTAQPVIAIYQPPNLNAKMDVLSLNARTTTATTNAQTTAASQPWSLNSSASPQQTLQPQPKSPSPINQRLAYAQTNLVQTTALHVHQLAKTTSATRRVHLQSTRVPTTTIFHARLLLARGASTATGVIAPSLVEQTVAGKSGPENASAQTGLKVKPIV